MFRTKHKHDLLPVTIRSMTVEQLGLATAEYLLGFERVKRQGEATYAAPRYQETAPGEIFQEKAYLHGMEPFDPFENPVHRHAVERHLAEEVVRAWLQPHFMVALTRLALGPHAIADAGAPRGDWRLVMSVDELAHCVWCGIEVKARAMLIATSRYQVEVG